MNIARDAVELPELDVAENANRHTLGAILVQEGKLSPADADRVYDFQQKKRLRFGDAAVRLKLVRPADVQFALSRQFDYPFLPARNRSISHELIAAFEPFGATAEAFRQMRAQLSLRWSNGSVAERTLAVLSSTAGDGRTFVAANLAVVFSQLGERTLLIDADLRRGRLHELFELENQSGVSTILAGRMSAQEIQRIPALSNLFVLPSGPVPPNPQELLNRAAFRTLLDQVSHGFDIVVLDTSASEEGADCQIVASMAEASVLVVRNNQTKLTALHSLEALLKARKVTVAGAFMND